VFVPSGYGVEADEEYREAAEEYRDVEDLARRLEGARGLVFVVVGSSWEAVKLAATLSGRLRLVYLPALYGELVEGRRRKLAWVSHDGLCAAYEGRVVGGACEGLAPGLLSLPLEELEAGVEALEALRKSHKNLGEAALRLLLDVAGIVGPFGGVATAVKAVYDFFQGAIRQIYGEVAGLLKFVEAAEKARAYVRRPEFEALVDSVALEWEMETGRFKTLVEALGDPSLVDWLAHGRHVDSLSKFGRVYARYNAEELGVTEEYVIEAGVRYPLAKRVFVEKAGEVMRLMGSNKAVVLKGPRGVGKSTLAKYVAYTMLMQEQVDYVVVPEEPINVDELLKTVTSLQRRVLLLFDVHPREVYMPRFLPGAAEGVEKPLEAAARAINSLLAVAKAVNSPLAAAEPDTVGRLRVLLTASDDELKALGVKLDPAAEYRVDLGDVEFLAEVVKSYMGKRAESCQEVEKLARIIKEHHPEGAYTLVAKYAGLWLRERGCDVSDVKRAVEEAKSQPKLFLAQYIWQVLLRGSGNSARRAAVPLLLHAVFGPVPIGVTYVTKAAKNGVWRFLKPEELEGVGLEYLREDELEPIARWLAQWHEDLMEEALRDLAGLNGEEARETYREVLRDLIKTLDCARNEILKKSLAELGIPKDKALKVFNIIFAKFGIPEKDRELATSLLAFISRRLAAVFKSDENKCCWRRAALIAGHALAGHSVVPKTKPAEDCAEALGDVSESCAVDVYLTIDGEIPPLSVYIIRIPYEIEALYASDLSKGQRVKQILGVLTPFADAETIKEVKRTAEELLAKWRIGEIVSSEVFYGLGLAVLAAEGEVDGETADLLIRVASNAVRRVTHSAAALPVLEVLRPLGEKAPHRYIVALAAASELIAPYQETALYIYNTLQQLKNRLSESKQIWPLVEAVDIYSNLLRKHLIHIINRLEDPTYAMDFLDQAVVEMCSLYGRVKSDRAVAPNGGFSALHLLETVARASVLAVALENNGLASLVQRYCNFGDIEKEAEAVRKTLEEAAAHPDELRKIAESDADFSGWISTRSVKGDARKAFEDLRAWFTSETALYKLRHALNERGDLDQEKLKQAAKEFEDAAEIAFSSGHLVVSRGEEKLFKDLEQWKNYLNFSYWALRAYILAAKSCEEFLRPTEGLQTPKTTKSFPKLWEEANKNIIPTAEYLETTANIFGGYLVCLAASGKKQEVEELLKEWRWLLYYSPEVSVATRLMLKLFGVGEGAKLDEIVYVFWPRLSQGYYPALWLLAGHLQRDRALDECARFIPPWLEALYAVARSVKFMSELCIDAVAAAAGNRVAAERLKSEIESEAPEAHRLLNKVDGRILVEVLAPIHSQAQLAFMLLAAVEGKADAVRLHGLWGSARLKEPLPRRLFRAVYESCSDLNSEGCRIALLKLYYTPVLAALPVAGPPRGGGPQNRFISAPWI
jgi:hypothetical protein